MGINVDFQNHQLREGFWLLGSTGSKNTAHKLCIRNRVQGSRGLTKRSRQLSTCSREIEDLPIKARSVQQSRNTRATGQMSLQAAAWSFSSRVVAPGSLLLSYCLQTDSYNPKAWSKDQPVIMRCQKQRIFYSLSSTTRYSQRALGRLTQVVQTLGQWFFHMAVVCTATSLFVLDTRDCDSWVNGTLPNLAKWVCWPILIP